MPNATTLLAEAAIAECAPALRNLDLSDCDEDDLGRLLAEVRGLQRCLDGVVIRVGCRSNHLAKTGRSAPADETVRGKGPSAVGGKQARRETKRSETVSDIPGLGTAVDQGETSGDHIDIIARYVNKLTDNERTQLNMNELLDRAKEMDPDAFARYVKRQIARVKGDHGLADTKAKQQAAEFRHWFDHKSGMGRITGLLDPERYEALTNAIDQHTATLAAASAEPLNKSFNLAAEALVQLVTSAGQRNTRNRLPSVTVLVDHKTIARGPHDQSVRQTEQGHDLPPETIARLCCDATIRRITLDTTGVPINVGRKYRTATDAQWAALKSMHDSCAWEGCTAPINWTQAHHIREWEHGGPTDLDNLIPLCSRHHHQVHEGQWHIKLLPDRTLKIYKPNGAHHTTVPPPRRE